MNYIGKKVGVLLGGMSAERDVSFATGRAVAKGLREKGYDVVEIDAQKDLPQQLITKGVEVVYNALHGKFGEDGCIQGLLEVMGIPYTGSGVASSAIAMDKQITNDILSQRGLPVPATVLVERDRQDEFSVDQLPIPMPVFVKPATEGSSVGISRVNEKSEMAAALAEAFKWDRRVLVQQAIEGREITVGMIDDTVLGTVEVRPKLEFYNYEAKYTKGMTEYLVPAPLSKETEAALYKMAQTASRVLCCQGAVRADFILDKLDSPFFLEVNTLPGLTETSLIPKLAAGMNMSFADLVDRVLSGACLKMGS